MKFILSREEEGIFLRFEPSAMILAREGDFTALAGQLMTMVAVVGVWISGWSLGLTGEFLLAWIVGNAVIVGGGMAFYMAMRAINYTVKMHPRLVLIGTEGHLMGFPGRDEHIVAMSEISSFTVRRRWSFRPWRRYAVIYLDQQFREHRLTPSVLRRSDAADVAAALTEWLHHPAEFEEAVARKKAHEFLEALWSGCLPKVALEVAAAA